MEYKSIPITLSLAAKARRGSIKQIEERTKLTRASISSALKEGGNPTIKTLSMIAGELGYRLTLEPLPEQSQAAK